MTSIILLHAGSDSIILKIKICRDSFNDARQNRSFSI